MMIFVDVGHINCDTEEIVNFRLDKRLFLTRSSPKNSQKNDRPKSGGSPRAAEMCERPADMSAIELAEDQRLIVGRLS